MIQLNMVQLKIRSATSDDMPFMIDLERSVASAAHWSESQYAGLLSPTASGRPALVLVAEAAPEPTSRPPLAPAASLLGFLVARQIAPEWELENIVVAPSMQRRGIGKQLLRALLDAAIRTNSKAVFLEVRDSNRAARPLYEKLGFRQVGRRTSYYKNPEEDAILYRFDLG
jgi:ribosomal-protein-alanine N-acetyltransferase